MSRLFFNCEQLPDECCYCNKPPLHVYKETNILITRIREVCEKHRKLLVLFGVKPVEAMIAEKEFLEE